MVLLVRESEATSPDWTLLIEYSETIGVRETVPRFGVHGESGVPERLGLGIMFPGMGTGPAEVRAITGELVKIGENIMEKIIALYNILIASFMVYLGFYVYLIMH